MPACAQELLSHVDHMKSHASAPGLIIYLTRRDKGILFQGETYTAIFLKVTPLGVPWNTSYLPPLILQQPSTFVSLLPMILPIIQVP